MLKYQIEWIQSHVLFWGPEGDCFVLCAFLSPSSYRVEYLRGKVANECFCYYVLIFEFDQRSCTLCWGWGGWYYAKPFISVSYCVFWMHKLQFSPFQGHIILLLSRWCLVNLPACKMMVCFSPSLLVKKKKKNQKCRFCPCTYACCSQNQSVPRPSISTTHDEFACRPLPHNCCTYACPAAMRCALKCTLHWQPMAGNWGVDLCCSSASCPYLYFWKDRDSMFHLKCLFIYFILFIYFFYKTQKSILHTLKEVQMGTAASTGIKCLECCHLSRRLRMPKVWKTWGRELRGKYRGYQICVRVLRLAAL